MGTSTSTIERLKLLAISLIITLNTSIILYNIRQFDKKPKSLAIFFQLLNGQVICKWSVDWINVYYCDQPQLLWCVGWTMTSGTHPWLSCCIIEGLVHKWNKSSRELGCNGIMGPNNREINLKQIKLTLASMKKTSTENVKKQLSNINLFSSLLWHC